MLEKYAFVCGGGYNHRYGLYDRIMIKDNHWAALASETDAHAIESLNQLRQDYPELPMHIEVDRCDQIERAPWKRVPIASFSIISPPKH